jgi:hypothetical protein
MLRVARLGDAGDLHVGPVRILDVKADVVLGTRFVAEIQP